MKLILQAITFALVIITTTLSAQELPIYQDYFWSNSPEPHPLDEKLKSYPAVYILHNRFLELRVNATGARTWFTEHKIIHINSAAGIEQFNKVYLPLYGDRRLMSLQVRSISPDGTVTELKKENLKELKNVQGYGNFKIFAVEGLTIGGEVEYLYTIDSPPQSFGRYVLQEEIPVQEANVEIVCPLRIEFSAKSYNGLAQPKKGFLGKERRYHDTYATNIPALPEEEYSAHRANLMRVDFKLENNGTKYGLLSWESISENMLSSCYEYGAEFKIKRLLKPLKLDGLSEQEKIETVEEFIKTTFSLKEGESDDLETLRSVTEKKVANDRGMIKLFMACWEELGIVPEMVLCGNRFKGKIDESFATPLDISEIIFYFPKLKKYITPVVPYLRLGSPPDNVISSNGVFITYGYRNGRVSYEKNQLRKIESFAIDQETLGVKALVHFNNNLALPIVSQTNSWQGTRAATYRGLYYYGDEAGKENFFKQTTTSGIEGVDVSKREVVGDALKNSFDPKSSFIVKTEYTASSLVEQAGEDYLFAIGKIIGRQSELYQESQRQMDIEFHSYADYHHELVVEIPQGYTCTGLETLDIKNELKNGNDVLMKFESTHELQGNKLIVRINEFYKVLQLPKQRYQEFRKVVNSAADFNKAVLILHPTPQN